MSWRMTPTHGTTLILISVSLNYYYWFVLHLIKFINTVTCLVNAILYFIWRNLLVANLVSIFVMQSFMFWAVKSYVVSEYWIMNILWVFNEHIFIWVSSSIVKFTNLLHSVVGSTVYFVDLYKKIFSHIDVRLKTN